MMVSGLQINTQARQPWSHSSSRSENISSACGNQGEEEGKESIQGVKLLGYLQAWCRVSERPQACWRRGGGGGEGLSLGSRVRGASVSFRGAASLSPSGDKEGSWLPWSQPMKTRSAVIRRYLMEVKSRRRRRRSEEFRLITCVARLPASPWPQTLGFP
ncbi:hypothetical protein AMECASPLE_003344 [Ameca splendens]|uniref:Uncharacterized protein n=1 Tax=Ameca splendens TaxID=208324 RepID=A0ABV1A5U8_9TELE